MDLYVIKVVADTKKYFGTDLHVLPIVFHKPCALETSAAQLDLGATQYVVVRVVCIPISASLLS